MSRLENPRIEAEDAEKVTAAQQVLLGGDLQRAEAMLAPVIKNTPDEYRNSTGTKRGEGGVSVKFWDQDDFIHFVTWQQAKWKKTGEEPFGIQWIGNAYPRAHYYMGFLLVKRKNFARAIKFLRRGIELEPRSALLKCELARALILSGKHDQALKVYRQVKKVGPYVSAKKLAVAKRGCGFVLVDLGRLDEAQLAFEESLTLDPENQIALSELNYIAKLRKGGRKVSGTNVTSTISGDSTSKCFRCKGNVNKGKVVTYKGSPVSICRKCAGKLSKKWWQIWK